MDFTVFILCFAFIFSVHFDGLISSSSSAAAAAVIPLSHSISVPHFNTTHHLLKATTARAAARFLRYSNRVSLPLSPGSDYTLSFSVRNQTISLYMDTGSDVVWIPCRPFRCILCEGKYSPAAVAHPGPVNISVVSSQSDCMSAACSAAHSGKSSSDLCAIAKCPLESIEMGECGSFSCPPFYYAYGDGSFIAKLYEDTLSIPLSTPALNLPNFTFGCAHSALGEPIGVAGFGRGVLSLPAQLAAFLPEIGNYFSYCLISHSFNEARVRQPSPLILGRSERKGKIEFGESADVVSYSYTPLLDNPKHSYYYSVGLEAVTIGDRRIPAPSSLQRVDRRGNGGMVVDSGTTFTMLPSKLYKSIVGEFDRRFGTLYSRATAVEERTGLSPCYHNQAGDNQWRNLPKLALHFGGNSTVALPTRNYFYDFSDDDAHRRAGCLMLMDGGTSGDGGAAGLLGNYQQQGFEVVYDLQEKRVGFARRKCASLWDKLN
ncbi:hypothetical protein M569_04276 [Genlisea aurea]|uniref:Peptidase A1 domain-containing protein n=1 Tax=Genlisea aurea TaxID=192259 RepID=S8E441_9LAMI|nr:hypothetical protein M569_04276 [Genlisea aurea]